MHPGNGKGIMAALLALRCPAWPAHFDRTAVTFEERQALRNLLLQVDSPLSLQLPQSWHMASEWTAPRVNLHACPWGRAWEQ